MARRAHEQEWAKLTSAQRAAWIRLLAVHRDVTSKVDAALQAEHGLSLVEWDALVRLAPAERGARMRDLAELVLLTPSGLSRLVDRLASRGLVERAASAGDARETLVKVTPRGLALLAEAAPCHNEELKAHFFDPLGAEDVAKLASILGTIVDADAACARHPAAKGRRGG